MAHEEPVRPIGLPPAEQDNAREDRLLKGIAGASVLLMLLLLAMAYGNLREYKVQNEALRASHRILQQLELVHSVIKDAETGCRGYLLTNDTAFLTPYILARPRLDSAVHDLLVQLPDSEATSPQLALRMHLEQKLLAMQQMIQEQRSGKREVGKPDMRLMMRSKEHMDQLREIHERMLDRYGTALRNRAEQEESLGLVTPMMILLYALIALTGIAVLFFRMLRTLDRARLAESLARDAAEQRDAEARTRELAQRSLTRVLDSSPSGIMAFRSVRDAQGRIIDFEWTMANAAAGKLTGRSPEQLIGQRLLKEMPGNGSMGLFQRYVQVVESGEPMAHEFHYESEGIDSWFDSSAVRLLDGFVVTFADITERRNEQLLLQESQRLAVTGRFARTVAHEVRNPLTNIQLALDQLESETGHASPEHMLYMGILKRNAERIGTLITQMLHSARPLSVDLRPGSINSMLRDVFDQVKDRCELLSMRCDLDLAEDLSFVPMDQETLTIACVNLCVNAIEAMEAGKGQLQVVSREVEGKVRVTIRDNGKGLSEADQEHIFQPFFSGRKGGMGLGLTEARNILNAHNVLLTLESRPGEGTAFNLVFPALG